MTTVRPSFQLHGCAREGDGETAGQEAPFPADRIQEDELSRTLVQQNQGNLKAKQAASSVNAAQKNQPGVETAKGQAAAFHFAMLDDVGVKIGSELAFVYGGQKVRVADLKNKIEFNGEVYTTSGFCKKFMPKEKRNSKDAYQGPKYFTFKE